MNPSDIKDLGDVERWLRNDVEWNDIASQDVATVAIDVIRRATQQTEQPSREFLESLNNPSGFAVLLCNKLYGESVGSQYAPSIADLVRDRDSAIRAGAIRELEIWAKLQRGAEQIHAAEVAAAHHEGQRLGRTEMREAASRLMLALIGPSTSEEADEAYRYAAGEIGHLSVEPPARAPETRKP